MTLNSNSTITITKTKQKKKENNNNNNNNKKDRQSARQGTQQEHQYTGMRQNPMHRAAVSKPTGRPSPSRRKKQIQMRTTRRRECGSSIDDQRPRESRHDARNNDDNDARVCAKRSFVIRNESSLAIRYQLMSQAISHGPWRSDRL